MTNLSALILLYISFPKFETIIVSKLAQKLKVCHNMDVYQDDLPVIGPLET